MRIDFLGAAGTVTGSRYLVTSNGRRVLVDCGLFQGLKNLRELNWKPFPVPASTIEAVVLTHAHIDHSGYLPLLVKQGFRGPIVCTAATADLCRILLPDSAHLQEEEAKHANRKHSSKHHPAMPLYTTDDAAAALTLLQPVDFGRDTKVGPVTVQFRHASHILGASSAYLSDDTIRIALSGDIGRDDDPVLRAPDRFAGADYVVIESTYGDRLHPVMPSDDSLIAAIARTIGRQGTVVIPAFAVGRAQLLLYYLTSLQATGKIPKAPIYLDSPMAAQVTEVLRKHVEELRISAEAIEALMHSVHITGTVEESKALDCSSEPKIIISASGMATGGRVLFHLQRFAHDPSNLIVISGYQAAGTRGAAIANGAPDVKIFGQYVPVRAEVVVTQSLSSHADAAGLMRWLRGVDEPPIQVFVTHGEPAQSDALRQRIGRDLGWQAVAPRAEEGFELGAPVRVQPPAPARRLVQSA
jgi:metallo-beta-lactamase family protein